MSHNQIGLLVLLLILTCLFVGHISYLFLDAKSHGKHPRDMDGFSLLKVFYYFFDLNSYESKGVRLDKKIKKAQRDIQLIEINNEKKERLRELEEVKKLLSSKS